MIKSRKTARYYRNLLGVRNVAKIIISAKTGKENLKGKPYTYKTEKKKNNEIEVCDGVPRG